MEVLKNVEMKEYSNMKVGGIAKELIFVEEKNELKEIIDKAYNPRNDIKNEYLEEAVKEIGKKYVLTKDRKLSRRKDENNPYK